MALQHDGQSSQRDRDADRDDDGSERPLLVLRPIFISWVIVLRVALPVVMVFLGFGGIFSLPFLVGDVEVGDEDVSGAVVGFVIVAALLLVIGGPLIAYVVKQRTYAKTSYRFFRAHIEYYEGFWTTEKRSLEYRNIMEVYLRKGVIQKMYGLGSIVLSTPATGYSEKGRVGGISIADIKDPEEVYKSIQDLVKQAKE